MAIFSEFQKKLPKMTDYCDISAFKKCFNEWEVKYLNCAVIDLYDIVRKKLGIIVLKGAAQNIILGTTKSKTRRWISVSTNESTADKSRAVT